MSANLKEKEQSSSSYSVPDAESMNSQQSSFSVPPAPPNSNANLASSSSSSSSGTLSPTSSGSGPNASSLSSSNPAAAARGSVTATSAAAIAAGEGQPEGQNFAEESDSSSPASASSTEGAPPEDSQYANMITQSSATATASAGDGDGGDNKNNSQQQQQQQQQSSPLEEAEAKIKYLTATLDIKENDIQELNNAIQKLATENERFRSDLVSLKEELKEKNKLLAAATSSSSSPTSPTGGSSNTDQEQAQKTCSKCLAHPSLPNRDFCNDCWQQFVQGNVQTSSSISGFGSKKLGDPCNRRNCACAGKPEFDWFCSDVCKTGNQGCASPVHGAPAKNNYNNAPAAAAVAGGSVGPGQTSFNNTNYNNQQPAWQQPSLDLCLYCHSNIKMKGVTICETCSDATIARYSQIVEQLEHQQQMLRFYEKSAPFYEFTNFFPCEIEERGKIYPTSEHLFQAWKFLDTAPEVAEEIRVSSGPRRAFDLAHKYYRQERRDWKDIRVNVMYISLCKKFKNPHLRRVLLCTKATLPLVEHTHLDRFWANGADDTGENMLGKLLMRVRWEIQNGQEPDLDAMQQQGQQQQQQQQQQASAQPQTQVQQPNSPTQTVMNNSSFSGSGSGGMQNQQATQSQSPPNFQPPNFQPPQQAQQSQQQQPTNFQAPTFKPPPPPQQAQQQQSPPNFQPPHLPNNNNNNNNNNNQQQQFHPEANFKPPQSQQQSQQPPAFQPPPNFQPPNFQPPGQN